MIYKIVLLLQVYVAVENFYSINGSKIIGLTSCITVHTTPDKKRCDSANVSIIAFLPPFPLLSVGKNLPILREYQTIAPATNIEQW